MSGTTVAIIVVVVIVIVALIVAALATARRRRLQQRFGPEYGRVASEQKSQLKAESELASRERRVKSLDIRPLSAQAQAEYAVRWATIQEQFVDQPEQSVAQAQDLVHVVMRDRGYPVEGHDQTVADLSVEHAGTLEQYRSAHAISESAAAGQASTEDLRQAMVHYRALFSDLLGQPQDGEARAASGPGPRAAASMDADPSQDPTATVPDEPVAGEPVAGEPDQARWGRRA
jgi:FtsZ-interacting cell division protein ZipA